ncbi:GtrA family protein [Oricola cellulosilytica]|uniref:GtrA family protein n=1 Tax=Oricola cellulosilytica TaxID=1429082 RepID=A0A4V2MP80_9HYPH|nr:GtrA family protein [Oricola cellulosilytica]TCD16712.1 GtrA family protein [Oricola cellulosilytica]
MRRFFGFAVAGGTGFVVDASVLTGLMAFTPLGPFSARIFAIGAAMFATWMINRTMTFGKSDRHVVREGARYGAVAITGAVLNYAIYSGLLLAAPNLFTPLGALVIAVAFVTVFSYVGYSRFVFSRG